jgi:hypothetical protein
VLHLVGIDQQGREHRLLKPISGVGVPNGVIAQRERLAAS